MKQAQVTDYFNASRKNVKRSLKNASKVSPQVSLEAAGLSPKRLDSLQSFQKTRLKRLPSDGGKVGPMSQKAPAFKRFRHLLPSDTSLHCNELKETPQSPVSTPGTSPARKRLDRAKECPSRATKASDLRPGASALLHRLEKSHSPTKSPQKPLSPSKVRPAACLLAERLAVTKKGEIPSVKDLESPPKKHSGSSLLASRLAQAQAECPRSPGKGPTKRPAHERFAHLLPGATPAVVSSEPQLPSLPLPFTYQVLLDTFKTMDNVSNMLTGRKELLTFERLQESVQKVLRRDFTQDILGQMLRIYPNSFSLRYEKNVPKFGKKVSAKFELLIDVELKGDGTPMSHLTDTERTFNATRLVQRREKFLANIMRLLLEKHRIFLCETMGFSSGDLPKDADLKRWHPRFPMDKLEAPEPLPFPKRPEEEPDRFVSAQEAVKMFRARGMAREVEACERALAKLSESRREDPKKAVQLPQGQKKPKDSLQGVSKSLLEKIRAKEAAKAAELLVRGGPEFRRRQEMVSRLPDLAMHTWNLFATSRKPVLAMSFLCEKIADSHPSGLSPSGIHDHLRLLAELLPDWLELLPWTTPHARLLNSKRNLAQVRAFLAGQLEEAPPS